MTSSPLPNLQRAPEPLEQHHVQLRTSRQIAQRSPEINMRSVQQHGVDPPAGAGPRQLDQQRVRCVVEHGGHGVFAGRIGHEHGRPRGRRGGADEVEGGEHAVEGGGGRAVAGTASAGGGGKGVRGVVGEGGQGGSEGRGELICGADVEFAPDDGAAVDALEGVNAAFETDELVYGGEVGEGGVSVAEDDLDRGRVVSVPEAFCCVGFYRTAAHAIPAIALTYASETFRCLLDVEYDKFSLIELKALCLNSR